MAATGIWTEDVIPITDVAQDALADLGLLAARMLTDSDDRIDLDDVLRAYGVTRDELRERRPD